MAYVMQAIQSVYHLLKDVKKTYLITCSISLLSFACTQKKEIKRDFVKFDMVESYQDSILIDTRGKRPIYMIRDSFTMSKELFAALKIAKKGEWTSLELEPDSVFKHGHQKSFSKGGKVLVKIRVLGFLSTETELKKDMEKFK